MAYVNFTPHTLTIHHSNGSTIVVPPFGHSLRVSSESTLVGEVDNVEQFTVEYGELEIIENGSKSVVGKMPVQVDGVTYVVSGQCLEAVKQKHPDRTDFVAPGELVRDAAGQPIGCKGVKRI